MSITDDRVHWRIDIKRDGIWPLPWSWAVVNEDTIQVRVGSARTKDRAQHKAAAARVSMERDDLEIRE